jgi:hypothetical protein
MKKVLLAVLSAVIIMSAVPVSASSEKIQAADRQGAYFGIFREGAPANMELVKSLEKKTGAKFPVVMWYQDYSSLFNPDLANRVVANGAIPHIVWEPWLWNDKEKIKLDNINAGEWDAHIREWAQDIKAWGKPVFIRWGHEFNLEHYSWSLVQNNRDASKYIAAFRRVRNIFRKEGANNAMFVWAPNNDSWPQEPWNDIHRAYPGDEYVDWIGLDGYNWGTVNEWSSWQSFRQLFRDVARQMWRKYPTKPIMIAEFASANEGGDKAKWIEEMLQDLKRMPYIRSVIWFDKVKETDWRIEASPKTLASFKKVINDPYFIKDSASLAKLMAGAPMKIVRKSAAAQFTAKPVNINGDLSDWADAKPLYLNQVSQLQEGFSEWKGAKDLSGKIFVKWDNSNLYIAADVNDDAPLKNSKTKNNIWNGDAIELTIGLNPSADPGRDSFVKGDKQIGLGTGDGSKVKPSVWDWTSARAPQGSRIAVKKRPGGYTLEANIPWASIGSLTPAAGMRLGFDCAIDDSDNGKSRTKQIVWNGDYMFYKDPGVWGVLELVK